MKKQTFVYIIVGSGAVLILYLLNQNKNLTHKSKASNCSNENLLYNPKTKKCSTWAEIAESLK